MEPVTVTLTDPVKAFGREVSALVIARKMKGKDLVAIEGQGEFRALLLTIQRLYTDQDGKQLPMESVEDLTREDISRLEAAMRPFAGIGPAT